MRIFLSCAGEAAEAAVKSEGALVDLWDNETRGIATTEKSVIATYLYGTGDATLGTFVGDPKTVAELYRAPDLHAALYFAFFMVTDPPTSPPSARDQAIFGVITAAAAFAIFDVVHSAYFLLAGLLVANAWEGWRRVRLRAKKKLLQRENQYQRAVL